jgi:hypothetical protein
MSDLQNLTPAEQAAVMAKCTSHGMSSVFVSETAPP